MTKLDSKSLKATKAAIKAAMRRALDAKSRGPHLISYDHHDRPLVPGCTRAICTCGWGSDSYASSSDARRAADVHLLRVQRAELLRCAGCRP